MTAIIDTCYSDLIQRFINANIEPLCGWPWLEQNMHKKHPEQTMTILHDGKVVFTTTKDKESKAVKAAMELAKLR